jgi:transportin-1
VAYTVLCFQVEYDRAEEEAEEAGDKEINFKPVHHRSRGGAEKQDDEDNGDDSEDAGDNSGMWTIRKEAARVIDVISCAIPTELVLGIALPRLQQLLSSADPWMIESGNIADVQCYIGSL